MGVATGGMRVPNSDVPCIFVGPGTGIAPMRAMIEQRVEMNVKSTLLRDDAKIRRYPRIRKSKSIERFSV